jgi:hypothetical protein
VHSTVNWYTYVVLIRLNDVAADRLILGADATFCTLLPAAWDRSTVRARASGHRNSPNQVIKKKKKKEEEEEKV